MSQTKIAVKTFPDLVTKHKDLPIDYFEISIRPTVFGKQTSLESQLASFKDIKDSVIGIHGAIYREGVNLLDPKSESTNQKAFNYVKKAQDYFPNCQYALFHPGHIIPNSACSFETLFSFLKNNFLDKLVIEFEPFVAYDQRFVFPIHNSQDWATFQEKIQKPIVLDTAHCFITAQALGYDFYSYFEKLTTLLSPKIIHLSNTDLSDGGLNDKHLHLSEGVIDFSKIAHLLENKILVIEVNNITNHDIEYVHTILEKVSV